MLNPTRFPRACAYLRQLPNGLDSYPQCKTKHEAVAMALERAPFLSEEPELPAPIESAVRSATGAWHSEVVSQTVWLMMRDQAFSSDQELLSYAYDANARLFNRALYRALMKLVSPNLLVMGAARRWSTFRTGTELRPGATEKRDGRQHGSAVLTHPPGLMSDLFLESLCPTFRAALDSSRGRGVRVEIAERTPEATHYRLSWDT